MLNLPVSLISEKKREMNQDSLFHDDDLGLYIVADGMGGHQGGEVASLLAVETIVKHFEQKDLEKTDDDRQGQYDAFLSKQADQLVSSIHRANEEVFKKACEDPGLKGMGTTVSGLYLTPETVIVANVGDSPVYLIRDHTIETLSVSHSLVSEKDKEKSSFAQVRHMLTRSVGVAQTVKVDSCEIQSFENDCFVLCSDGLCNLVKKDEIKKIVGRETPASACRLLVDLANERGGDDNITIIIVKIGSGGHNKKKDRGLISKLTHLLGINKKVKH